MSYSCKILLDSISETNKRLTTFEITFPRIVLAELNTHRMFSRNSASSRAIPFKTQIKSVKENTFVPEKFPVNEKGMQPKYYITKESNPLLWQELKWRWLYARDKAIQSAEDLYNGIALADLSLHSQELINNGGITKNIHKQIVNRLLEPFMWHTVIVTATEFDNFFKLRCDENAQYEIKRIADLMYEAYHWNLACYNNEVGKDEFSYDNPELGTISSIQKLKVGEWHCPLVSEDDYNPILEYISKNKLVYNEGNLKNYQDLKLEIRKKISVARCARVSYLTHDGKRDIEKDLELFERLRTSGHWSPFEHVATPYFIDKNTVIHNGIELDTKGDSEGWHISNRESYEDFAYDLRSGNFIGWKQFRKEFQDENCTNSREGN